MLIPMSTRHWNQPMQMVVKRTRKQQFGKRSENHTASTVTLVFVVVDMGTRHGGRGKPTSDEVQKSDAWHCEED